MSFSNKKSKTILCNYQPRRAFVRTCIITKLKKAASLIQGILIGCHPNRKNLKRTSPNTPLELKASITVEAAIVIPMFIFVMMNLSSVFYIYDLYSEVDDLLYRNAKQISDYAYAYEEVVDENCAIDFVSDVAIILSVQSEMNRMLEGHPVLDGKVLLLGSEILEDDMISLIATYQVKPIYSFMGFSKFRFMNVCKIRAFTGYEVELEKDEEEGGEYVYVTKKGKVYHKSLNCTYIKVNTTAVNAKDIGDYKSKSGEKYTACEICGDEPAAKYYITNYGNRYHTTVNCSSIKRDVIKISIHDVGNRTPCSKCGQ